VDDTPKGVLGLPTAPIGPDHPARQTPSQVRDFVDEATRRIEAALGVTPDGTSETLPLVDAFLDRARDANDDVLALVAALAGCYFGELVRTRFGGWWVTESAQPADWRVELEACFLQFHPVAIAAEAVRRAEVPGYDGQLTTHRSLESALHEILSQIHVTEDQYYSLAGRFDTIEQIVSVLVAMREQEGQHQVLAPQDYAAQSN
jgi:hypothetical protein